MMYLFFCKLKKDITTQIGKLGLIHFEKGTYVYVGSANNSVKRVHRHFSKNKKLHWHIDYLTSLDSCIPLFAYLINCNCESKYANYLIEHYTPIPGFGSTDTSDFSHLFLISKGKVYK